MSSLYTGYMDNYSGTVISNMDNRAILKILTAREYTTQRSIIEQLKNKCNVVIPQPTFSNKVKRNGLKVRELQMICDLYGYDLILSPRLNV